MNLLNICMISTIKYKLLTTIFVFITGTILAQPQNVTDSLGRKQGYWKKYVKDTLKYEGQFVNDKPVGEFKYYYPDKKIKAITLYSDSGRNAQTVMYFNNGKKNGEGLYIDKKKEGLWVYYGMNELKISEENYKNGIKEGTWKYFYDDKKINRIENYINGILDGECMEFYADSILKMKCFYKNGKLDGKYQYFYISGKILYTGYYKTDYKDGEWMFFNENNFGERKLTYKNGTLLKEEIILKHQEGSIKYINIEDIAYCYFKDKSTIIKLNSGEELPFSTDFNELEKQLGQYKFFRVKQDFIVSAWSVKNRKTFNTSNPVLILNPDPGKQIEVQKDNLEAFMSWAGIIKYE